MGLKAGLKKIGGTALEILKGVAPLAASAVGGPYAGAAMSIIAKSVGIEPDKVEDYILSGSPDDLVKLKLADIEFKKWVEEVGLRRDQLDVSDRKSARVLAGQTGVLVQATLSALFIGGYFYLMYLFFRNGMFEHMTEFAKGQLAILIGVVTASVPQILAFWFGSSRGSKEKTEAMAKAMAPPS